MGLFININYLSKWTILNIPRVWKGLMHYPTCLTLSEAGVCVLQKPME